MARNPRSGGFVCRQICREGRWEVRDEPSDEDPPFPVPRWGFLQGLPCGKICTPVTPLEGGNNGFRQGARKASGGNFRASIYLLANIIFSANFFISWTFTFSLNDSCFQAYIRAVKIHSIVSKRTEAPAWRCCHRGFAELKWDIGRVFRKEALAETLWRGTPPLCYDGPSDEGPTGTSRGRRLAHTREKKTSKRRWFSVSCLLSRTTIT